MTESQKIREEYNSLRQQDKETLRRIYSQSYRVCDTSTADKTSLVNGIIRARHGEKRVAKAFGELPSVNTAGYQFAHGKEPRGRGGWAFGTEMNTPMEKVFWAPSGTYAEAKRAAREHFRGEAVEIYVQS